MKKQAWEQMTMSELLAYDTKMEDILQDAGFYCLGCPSSQFETLKDACEIHGLSLEATMEKIEKGLYE